MSAATPGPAFPLTGALLFALASISGCGGDGPADPPSGTGVIQITVSTTGADPDPDGYVATLDGTGPALTVLATGASFADVPIGDHSVALSGLASNCTVDAESKGATVTDGATATVGFAVSCSAIPPPPPTVGSIRVVTSTIGNNPDPDGYQFSIDSGPAQAIGTSATATLTDLAFGLHTVLLSGVAPNCGIPRGWSPQVTVVGGDTANALFPVTCYAMGPSASLSTIQVDPASISIGFPGQIFLPMSTITVTVVDANGTPLQGLAVAVNATGTGNTLYPWPSPQDSWMTNASGVATFSLSSTMPEPKTITATVNGVINLDDTPVVTVVKSRTNVLLGSVEPEPSTAGGAFLVHVAVGGVLGIRPTGGTVSVSSNLEPDAGCTAPVIPEGSTNSTATCEMTLSIVSTHLLTATYSGDIQFEGGSSNVLEHVVIAP